MSCKLKHQFDHDPKVNVSPRVMYMELENVYETKTLPFCKLKIPTGHALLSRTFELYKS